MTQASEQSIIMYTHPSCAFSAAAKADYRKRQVEFVEIDLSLQPDEIPGLERLTGGERVTPVIVQNGDVTIGFKGGY